jgi:hypothetical protein
MDCFFSLLSSKIKSIDINRLILVSGIANNFRTVLYADEQIRINDGRGYLDSLKLLNKLNISYEVIDVDELRDNLADIPSCFILLPKSVLENHKMPDKNIRHFYPFYSAFSIESVRGKDVMLEVIGEGRTSEKHFSSSFEQLDSYKMIKTLPLEKLLYIIRVDISPKKLSDAEIVSYLLENCRNFLVDRNTVQENTHCHSGPQFYRLFLEYINCYSLTEKCEENRNAYLNQYIFTASLSAGSVGFYRYDFIKSLEKLCVTRCDKLVSCISELDACANGWRELSRLSRWYFGQNKLFDSSYCDQANAVIKDIRIKELSGIDMLSNILVKG